DASRDPSFRQLCEAPDRRVDLDGNGSADAAPEREVEDAFFVDLQLYWNTPWQARFTVGVNNAFDESPFVAPGNASLQGAFYDLPGRFWYVGYSQSW
ncbi:MAG TPA: hypothetical protein VND91_01275, partial [Candidatus Saccharimonadia bacterium]|nr:hypothetical protein [Candidatus Saccharimonadia bacterium]